MKKNKNRYRITLLWGFIFSIIFSISAASALDNTYYWIPSSGAIGSSGYTANWGSCGQSPTTYRITTLSSTGFICNSDYLTTTSSGDQFLAIYPTAYNSDTTITGKTGATFYLSGQGRTATYRFDLGYAKNGAFTSLGYVTQSASNTGSLYTIDMSGITGTAPSGSYLALKVSVTSSRGGRIYLGTNGGVTGSNSGRFYVSENPLIPPTPTYNVTVTAAPTSASTTDGNGYTYNIIVNNIGNTRGNYTLSLVDSDTVNFQSSMLGTTSMQINSGGSSNTTLTVSAKINGTIGAIDTTTVSVNSVENPIHTNSTQISTTIVNTSPTDYKIIVSADRYSIFSPWTGRASDTSLSANFTAYALLLDNNGKPVSGQGITFKIYSGGGTVKATKTSITQANGLASVPYDTYSDFTSNTDTDYGTWKIEAYMTNSPAIISSANMEIQAGGNTIGTGCKSNCHSTSIGTGGKPQSPYTDSYGQTSSRAIAAHKKVSHQNYGCYLCHTGYSEIKTGTYGNTSDVHKNMTCDNCHGTWSSFGSSSGTGIPRMPGCYDCHPVSNNNVSIISTLANLAAGNGISVYSYNFDLKKPLAAHNGTMYSLADSVPCIVCHGPAHNISKPYVTSKNNVTENEQCWACHTNRATIHKSNTNCVGCHTQDAHNISIGGGGPLPPVTYIPADPINLQNITGSFWVNHTWLPGTGNTTDSYNVSVNGTWHNGITNTYYNNTVGPHGWSNITLWAYNSSGTGSLSAGSVSQNTRVPNNPPAQNPIGNKNVTAGDLLTFTVSATDADNDTITYGTNATTGTLNTTTGVYSWQTTSSDAGAHVWYFNSNDNYGGVASETITVTVMVAPPSKYIPPAPSNLTSVQGNFWINNSWKAGAGNATDSYNITVNGSWINGTTNTYYNDTVVPHGWSNITVWAYNNSEGGSLSSAPVSQNTRVANNAPLQTSIGNRFVDEGGLLVFTVSATDADNDTIIYGTNATKGSFSTTTGNFSWIPGYGDAGVYVWYFNSSDGYGGIASETITVTVNNVPLSMTSSLPVGDPATMAGTAQTFEIALNRAVNATWYIDGLAVQADSSIASANYTNSTAAAGTYNVTVAATDGYDSVSKQWNWIVNLQPVYAPGITSWSNSKTNNNSPALIVNTSEPVNFNATANQTITTWNWYRDGVNQNNNNDTLTTSWDTSGTKSIQVNATNSNGTSNTITWIVTVLAQPEKYIPPSPNITSITGNFWVNTTWQPGTGNATDSYNVSVNGAWTNGTTNTSVNSSLSAHAWQNVTVYAYNASGGGSLGTSPAMQNTQIPDNPPIQSSIGAKSVDEGQWLNFTVHATDADNDTITYGTNATKGAFNTTTGDFSWVPSYGDAGIYTWYFNSSDNYGGISTENIAVTVNNVPLSVTSSAPAGDPTTTVGSLQTFEIALNRTANISWYIDGYGAQTNSEVVSANYTNSTAAAGIYNVTAISDDGYDSASKQWNWTVDSQSVYAPGIISWSNNKTNNDSLTLIVNISEPVNFNATANQTITTWNWYRDGVNQNNNNDNLTTSWNTSGTKSIQVNATNGNGTSNTITWTVLIESAGMGPNCLDCHRGAE